MKVSCVYRAALNEALRFAHAQMASLHEGDYFELQVRELPDDYLPHELHVYQVVRFVKGQIPNQLFSIRFDPPEFWVKDVTTGTTTNIIRFSEGLVGVVLNPTTIWPFAACQCEHSGKIGRADLPRYVTIREIDRIAVKDYLEREIASQQEKEAQRQKRLQEQQAREAKNQAISDDEINALINRCSMKG